MFRPRKDVCGGLWKKVTDGDGETKWLSRWKRDWPVQAEFLRWEQHVSTKHKLSAESSPSQAAANTPPPPPPTPVTVPPHLPSTFHLFLSK